MGSGRLMGAGPLNRRNWKSWKSCHSDFDYWPPNRGGHLIGFDCSNYVVLKNEIHEAFRVTVHRQFSRCCQNQRTADLVVSLFFTALVLSGYERAWFVHFRKALEFWSFSWVWPKAFKRPKNFTIFKVKCPKRMLRRGKESYGITYSTLMG